MRSVIVLSSIFALYSASPRSGVAQTQIDVHTCTQRGNTYNCDRSSFEALLQTAKTISTKAPLHDTASLKQLQRLATALGKTVQPESADLTFVLAKPEPDGIYFGPSDRRLATLLVYYKASSSNPGQLIWAESYSGQPDTPWPTAAHAVIEQFRKNTKPS